MVLVKGKRESKSRKFIEKDFTVEKSRIKRGKKAIKS
jgi:hypothetical protein